MYTYTTAHPSCALTTHTGAVNTDQQQSINSNEHILVRGISGSDSGRKMGGVHPISVPTCHLRPALAELMRGLGPHAQPWDTAPTLPPAGAHQASTLIWKTWQRQGGLLHTCWTETPLADDVQGHVGCLFGHSFMDEIVRLSVYLCVQGCLDAFVLGCTNKALKIWTWGELQWSARHREQGGSQGFSSHLAQTKELLD